MAVQLQPITYTPSEAVEAFIYGREVTGKSIETIRGYRNQLRRLTAYLEDAGLTDVSILSVKHLQAFFMDLQKVCNPPTVLSCGQCVRAFLNWMASEDMIDPLIPARLKVPRPKQKPRDPATPDQFQALLDAASASQTPERDIAMLLVLGDCGLRAGEIVAIRDSDLREDRIHVHGKGDKWRYVPIGERTREAIAKWLEVRPPRAPRLFTGRGNRALTRGGVGQLLERLCGKAGLDSVSPHQLRHMTATQWLRSGGDLARLQALLGHADIQTTINTYVHVTPDDVADAHATVGYVDGMGHIPGPRENRKLDGAEIRRVRQERGLTANQLAKVLHMSDTHLKAIERGEALPSVVLAAKLRNWLQENGWQPQTARKSHGSGPPAASQPPLLAYVRPDRGERLSQFRKAPRRQRA